MNIGELTSSYINLKFQHHHLDNRMIILRTKSCAFTINGLHSCQELPIYSARYNPKSNITDLLTSEETLEEARKCVFETIFSYEINWTSSKTRLMNLKDSRRVRMTSATGKPRNPRGWRNHRRANASCSGVVLVRQRLALWKIFQHKIGRD